MAAALPWDKGEALAIIAELNDRPGATLPILHALQEHFGYVDRACVPDVAAALNLSQAEIHGVLSFYHDFRAEPAGRRVIKLCRAEACQAVGCRALEAHVQRRLGIGFGQTTPDRRFTLEAVYCLGNCALGPAALVDGEIHGRLDAARLDALIGAGP